MSKMAAIGFDYDFTLANYTPEIQFLIYNLARDYLVNYMRYVTIVFELIVPLDILKES